MIEPSFEPAVPGPKPGPRAWWRELQRLGATQEGQAWLLLGLGALPYVWLLFSVQYLPMQDLPGHIELSYLHDRVSAGDPAFTGNYRIAPQPWPNSLSTLLLSLFGGALGFPVGVKLILALYVLTWPLSLGLLARSLGRTPALALLALPTIVDFNWAIGFLNYLLAKPVTVAALVGALWFCRRPSPGRGAALFGLLTLSFIAHAIAYAVAMAGAGLAIVYFSRRWRRLTNLWPVVLACAVPYRYVAAQARAKAPGSWSWYDFDTGIPWGWNHLGDLGSSNFEEWTYVISFALWLLVFLWQQHRPDGRGDGPHAESSSLFLWLGGFLLFVLYGWGPAHMPNVAIICPRLLVFAWVLMLLLPLGMPSGWRRAVVVAGMCLAVGLHVGGTSSRYARFNRVEMAGFEELVRMIPPGKALAVHYARLQSPFAKHAAMWHWPKLHTVWNGGGARTDDSFASRSTSFVTLTEPALATGTFTGSPGLNPGALARWDYLLVHGGDRPGIAAAVASVATPVGTRSEWHLYRIRKPGN